MGNELRLTHLWLDGGLLLANDLKCGFLILCTEAEFHSGKNDSLKKLWMASESGIRYRKIKRTKKCFSAFLTQYHAIIYQHNKQFVDESFEKCYGKK